MYWDVIEVEPEPAYGLRVWFADGLSGCIHLEEKELVGALAPLRDPEYFSRVFVDQGAVAWPGNIDLAPDAMYRQVRSSK